MTQCHVTSYFINTANVLSMAAMLINTRMLWTRWLVMLSILFKPVERELVLIYQKQCAINGSDIDKHKDALDKMAGDIEYAFQDSRSSTSSALQTFDAFVIGHTASHQYYQMFLFVILYLECGTNHTDLCKSSQIVPLDLTVVLRLKKEYAIARIDKASGTKPGTKKNE